MDKELSRRDFVALMGAGLAAAAGSIRAQPHTVYAYVGSWTQGPFGVGGGGGITIFSFDPASGSLNRLGHTGPEFENLNAGYLAVAPNGRVLYSTNEVKNLHG
ncbi:MAG TPA: beta-propeller fold lactonase family protein, partial [Gammaproteobacteria bacterium]